MAGQQSSYVVDYPDIFI